MDNEREQPWSLTSRLRFTMRDRLRMLCGIPLYVRFSTADYAHPTMGGISSVVQREWPADDPLTLEAESWLDKRARGR